jgi:hypothetical protein
MTIICDLYSQWIASIRDELTNAGFDHSNVTDQDCAIQWQSWKRRTVPTRIRTVQKAAEFNCPSDLQDGLDDLERAIVAGNPIWPWQSRLIDRPTFEDGLYNDFRVVHFHLGIGLDPTGYINRTGPLLFAAIDGVSVYEIGIYNHGEWFELDILDIIDTNWPHLLDHVTLRALDVKNCPNTRDEIRALRRGNVNTIIKLKSGRIIAPPGGGLAADGTSIEAVRSADRWAKLIRNGEQAIMANIHQQVAQGSMKSKDYHVLLHTTDDEISGVADNTFKWTLWKRT